MSKLTLNQAYLCNTHLFPKNGCVFLLFWSENKPPKNNLTLFSGKVDGKYQSLVITKVLFPVDEPLPTLGEFNRLLRSERKLFLKKILRYQQGKIEES